MSSNSGKATASPTEQVPVDKGQSQAQKAKGLFQLILDTLAVVVDKPMLKVAPEIGHLSPVIFTVGSLVLSIITLNYPIFLFSIAAGEASLLHSVLSSTSSYLATPFLEPMKEEKECDTPCKSYFQTMTPSRFNWVLKQGVGKTFPSTPMYFIAFASAYCIQCLTIFNQECSELGPAYSNRAYIAILGAVMFMLLYALYLISYGCDSILMLLGSVILGGLVGSFLCYQNYTLFGKQGVDILFIPPLVKRSGMDYICVSTR